MKVAVKYNRRLFDIDLPDTATLCKREWRVERVILCVYSSFGNRRTETTAATADGYRSATTEADSYRTEVTTLTTLRSSL